MNTEEAIKHLKNQGWVVHKIGKDYKAHRIGHKEWCPSNKWPLRYDHYKNTTYTARELIHLAKSQSAAPRSNTKVKENIKTFDKAIHRAAQRNLLNCKDLEKIDELTSPHEKIKAVNPWCWD
jgi:hypothetical protein